MDTQVKQPLLKSKNNNNIPNEIITLSGIIKHVRKHSSKLIFLTFLPNNNTDNNNNTNSSSSLQLAIQPRENQNIQELYRKYAKLIKPNVSMIASGIFGYTKTKTKTLFVHSFQPLKFKPGVSPSVLWDLLLLVEQQIISKATANTYIDNNNDNEELLLEDVLSMKKHDKKRWCSKKAREISTGRKRRGRVKAPVENKEILQKYMNNDKLKFKEIILNQSFLDDTCTLGDVDPTKNLKHFLSSLSTTTGITTTNNNNNNSYNNYYNKKKKKNDHDDIHNGTNINNDVKNQQTAMMIDRRIDYAKRKKRPQVQTLIKILKENMILKENQVIIDVGGGRGDLGLALAISFPKQQVIILEPNESSLKAGEQRAIELKIENIQFKCETLNDLAILNNGTSSSIATENNNDSSSSSSPIIVGLHCCGGLSDAILDLCGRKKLSFCLVTCCFNSYPNLRPRNICKSTNEYNILAKMAETNDFQDVEIQYNATRIINNLRILKYIIGDEDGDNVNVVKKKHKKAATSSSWSLINMYRFPREWSKRNYVLCGVYR